MKSILLPTLMLGLIATPCRAIPNSVFGPILQAESPLNGEDLTGMMLGAGLWRDGDELPGEWVDDGEVGISKESHLLARPEMFGHEVLMLRAIRREGRLSQLEASFVDAGSYFGYFDEKLPEGLGKRQVEEELGRRMADKQASFSERYDEVLADLRTKISGLADQRQGKEVRFGRGRMLRVEAEEWTKEGLAIRLFAADQRLVRVTISRVGEEAAGWLDAGLEDESARDRLARLASSVTREDGVVRIEGLRTVPQGYRPYCGLNTLAMSARHFGMHLDEDWMAAAAGFQNTGSAVGSNMVKLYHAVAAEAGLSLDRAPKFKDSTVRAALDRGLPVIVWRRFSHQRNRLHDQAARDPSIELPDPMAATERASWPGEDAPLHASVVTGYDPGKGEVLFLESWSGHDITRRMKVEEMAATTYLCFAFGP